MVNVGEGTQRLGMEHKVRLTRLFEHIFLTALTPECFGGLPGTWVGGWVGRCALWDDSFSLHVRP